MLIVVALGGNALLQRGQPLEAGIQKENVIIAAKGLAQLIAAGHQLVICHGNGPQVGLLALQSEAYKKVHTYPFDVLNAESQSMIGYMLQQALYNESQKSVVTLVTQVKVDPDDPAFNNPQKFIGPGYTEAKAVLIRREYNWTIKKDGDSYRRVIASPKPQKIIELKAINSLVKKGIIVICCGGGGVPVIFENKKLSGVEAVIDKDLTSALLAEKLKADKLLILTDVPGVYKDFGKENQKIIHEMSVCEAKQMELPEGSMGPKIKAACNFVANTNNEAHIGSVNEINDILFQSRGTKIYGD